MKKSNSQTNLPGDSNLFQEIRELILSARMAVAKSIDSVQVMTCFEIGRRIVEHKQKGSERAEYGKQIVIELSRNLIREFGRGFSQSNLEYMRKFYLVYRNRLSEKSQTATGKFLELSQISQTQFMQFNNNFRLSWSHYVFLITIKDKNTRDFYEIEAVS